VLCGDGQVHHLAGRLSLLRDPAGRVVGAMAVYTRVRLAWNLSYPHWMAEISLGGQTGVAQYDAAGSGCHPSARVGYLYGRILRYERSLNPCPVAVRRVRRVQYADLTQPVLDMCKR
jgi:hypothetical protein